MVPLGLLPLLDDLGVVRLSTYALAIHISPLISYLCSQLLTPLPLLYNGFTDNGRNVKSAIAQLKAMHTESVVTM